MGVSFGHPPAGAWYRETPNGGFVMGASTRGRATGLVVSFTTVWSLFTYFSFIHPLLDVKPLVSEWILGAFMTATSLFLIWICVLMIFGKVEVTSDGQTWTIFSGFRYRGATESVTISRISGISQELVPPKTSDAVEQHVIVIEAHQKPLKFGAELTAERREFILQALQQILIATQ